MAIRQRGSYKSIKNNRYGDNSSGNVSAEDSRDMFEDTADSVVFWIDDVVDEDDMASDSDEAVPTQQSVKAYVDNGATVGLNPDVRFYEVDDFFLGGQIISTAGFQKSATGSATSLLASDYRDTEDHTFGTFKIGVDGTGEVNIMGKGAGFQYGNGNDIEVSFRCSLETLSDGTDEYIVNIGIGRGFNTASGPSKGMFFRYSHSLSSGNWQAITEDSSATTTDSGVTADTTYHVFTITVNSDATSVVFKIDGTTVATHSTNIPANDLTLDFVGIQIESGASISNVRYIHADWYVLKVTNSSGR